MIYREEKKIFSQIDMIFIILFFLSFVNSALGTAFCVLLLGYITHGVEGEVKALLFITLRGILSSAISAEIGNGIIKWIVLLGISILILLNRYEDEEKWKLQRVFYAAAIFSVVICINSFCLSSYPVTACFKVVAFLLTFCAVIKGVYITRNTCRWNDFLCMLMSILMIISFLLIPFSRFRIVNDNFQGVYNHVNVMGVMCCVYLALVLNSTFFKQHYHIKKMVIIATFIMAFLSASRTGMVSSIVVLLLYSLFKVQNSAKRIVNIIVATFLIVLILVAVQSKSDNIIMNTVHDFLWKDSTESIMESREEIIQNSLERYRQHKITGTGFMVPYNQEIRDYSLKFDLIVEPGNMYYMLLGDTGIIGLLLFGILLIALLESGRIKRLFLLAAALMTNMGEMAFFSSNNYSILFFFLIAVYIFDKDNKREDFDRRNIV